MLLIRKHLSVSRRPCVGITLSQAAREENRCARPRRAHVSLFTSAGGQRRRAAPRRSGRHGHVVLIQKNEEHKPSIARPRGPPMIAYLNAKDNRCARSCIFLMTTVLLLFPSFIAVSSPSLSLYRILNNNRILIIDNDSNLISTVLSFLSF